MATIQKIDNTSASEAVEQQDFSFTAGRNAKWLSLFEDILAVSHKAKHSLAIHRV